MLWIRSTLPPIFRPRARTEEARTGRQQRARISTALVALALLAGCSEFLTEPAPGGAPSLALSFALPSAPVTEGAAAASPGAAFDRADGLTVRLLRGSTVVAQLDQAFASEGAVTRVSLPVELEVPEESFLLEVGLSWEGHPLFTASRSVLLELGATTEAELSLQPVPAGIAVAPESLLLEALGETAALSAAVTFATGDQIPGASLTWETADPSIVSVSSTGQVTALAEGPAQVIASSGTFSGTVEVEVRQRVATVLLEPTTLELPVGDLFTFLPRLEDSGGSEILSSRSTLWSSSNPSVAAVSGGGAVQGVAEGSATIEALVEGVTGSATVLVVAAGDPVDIPDAGLEAAIRAAIDKPSGPLLESDLLSLLELPAQNRGIQRLTGLEYAEFLEILLASNNLIQDLTPLASLENLEEIALRANLVSDLGPLLSTLAIGEGTTIDLRENPLSQLAICDQIPALLERGAVVLYDGECEPPPPDPVLGPWELVSIDGQLLPASYPELSNVVFYERNLVFAEDFTVLEFGLAFFIEEQQFVEFDNEDFDDRWERIGDQIRWYEVLSDGSELTLINFQLVGGDLVATDFGVPVVFSRPIGSEPVPSALVPSPATVPAPTHPLRPPR